MTVTIIEAHQLDCLPAHCPTCHAWTAVRHTYALVNGDSLQVLTRAVHETCACGWEETYRV